MFIKNRRKKSGGVALCIEKSLMAGKIKRRKREKQKYFQ